MIISALEAKPGMTLLEDVLLPNGSILINASQSLTDSLIETINRRGIKKIQIVPEHKAEQLDKPGKEPEKIEVPEILQVEEKQTLPQMPPKPPNLKIVISEDAMSAKLLIEPTDYPNQELSQADVANALLQAGVVHGINDKLLLDTIDKWSQNKRYFEIPDIAKGFPPQPPREGHFEFVVNHLTSVAHVEQVRKSRFFDQIPKELSIDRVDPGTVVAIQKDTLPEIPGTTVTGDVVPAPKAEKAEISCDSNLSMTDLGKKIVAQTTGIVFFLDNHLAGMVQFNFNGAAETIISPDKMRADILIHAPGPLGKAPTKEYIASLLKESSIEFGIKTDVLEKMIVDFDKKIFPPAPVVIACGLPAQNGNNGTVHFLFPTETTLKPKQNADGTVDYKNVAIVVSATKGQKLAELVPPTKGIPGKNVFGKEQPSQDGKPTQLPVGPNTEISAENPSVLVAATDGNVRYNGTSVEISEGFIVNGDVDFSTGNIKYPKSVIISGDIKTGFKVECGGDLQVSGTIEDTEILVNGNVLCKLGFIGQGKGFISAKGDVNIAFMKNQVIKSRQNIIIAKEALNASLFARKTIVIHGNPLSVAGGKLMARDSITVFTVGNLSGMKTVLEVGIDFTLVEEMEKCDGQIAELNAGKHKLVETIQKFDKMHDPKHKLSPKDELFLGKLRASIAKFDQQIKTLDDRKKIISSKMYSFGSCFIKIEHSAMPGTIFKIGNRHYSVKEEIIGPKTVHLINDEIRVV